MSKPNIKATFQPQANHGRRDIVDVGVPTELDLTRWLLGRGLPEVKAVFAESGRPGADLDRIAEASVMTQRHDGPYRVTLDDGDVAEFLSANGVASADALTEADLVRMRVEYGVRGGEHPFPVEEPALEKGSEEVEGLSVEIVDWRILDGEGDDLTEDQRKPWKVEFKKQGWGVTLDFVAPDGTTRSMNFELSEGNPRGFVNVDGEENLGCVTLGRASMHVRSDRDGVRPCPSVIIDDAGMRTAGEDADPDFAGGGSPTP